MLKEKHNYVFLRNQKAFSIIKFSIVCAVVQSLSHLFVTPWAADSPAAEDWSQASLFLTISWNLFKLMSNVTILFFNSKTIIMNSCLGKIMIQTLLWGNVNINMYMITILLKSLKKLAT